MTPADIQIVSEILARSIYLKHRNDNLTQSREMIERLKNKDRKNGKHN